jgi:uncharacterized protein (DUF302 family)
MNGVLTFLLGMVVMGTMVFFLMPKMMFVTHKSRYGFAETVQRLENIITNHGWGHKGTLSIHNDLRDKNIDFKPQVANVSLCKAPYAAEILQNEQQRFVAALMPCNFTVWESDNGHVHVTKMNTGLMGLLFGGKIAEIMGKKVSKEEKEMLKGVLKNS